jgi:ribose transport system ATP-binding protein
MVLCFRDGDEQSVGHAVVIGKEPNEAAYGCSRDWWGRMLGVAAPPAEPVVLEVSHLSKSFPGVRALEDVSLRVLRGQVHAIVGENGAGKSTLIKILTGVYGKDRGEICLDGRTVMIDSPATALGLGLAAIYQEIILIPDMTVAENITLGRYPSQLGVIDPAQLEARAAEVLAVLGQKINPRAPVRQLSVAMQQMVTVAKALAQDARILIMDEPTAALSQREIERLFQVIRRLKAEGVTFIYISHRLEEIFQVADRVTILRDGRVVGDFDVSEVDVERVISLMVGRTLHDLFPREKHVIGEEVLRVEAFESPGKFWDVNFSVHRGELLGIAGMVGSGRTEVVRALFGADAGARGRVYLHGRAVRFTNPREAIEQGMGLLPEERKSQGLVPLLSVRDNISLAILGRLSRFGIINHTRQSTLVLELVRRLGIRTPGLEQLAMYLSGGNQQKLVLAKWLARQCSVLIFDEPTRGVDVGSKAEIYRLMSEMCRRGAAVVMVSSELLELLSMSDKILVMRHGRVAGEIPREEATEEQVLNLALGLDHPKDSPSLAL